MDDLTALLSYVNPAGRRMMLDALVVNRVVAEKVHVVSHLRLSLSWSPFFVERLETKFSSQSLATPLTLKLPTCNSAQEFYI